MDDLTAALRAYFDVIHANTPEWRGESDAPLWTDPTIVFAAAAAVDAALGSPAPALRTMCTRFVYPTTTYRRYYLLAEDRAAGALASPEAATAAAFTCIRDIWVMIWWKGGVLERKLADELGCQSLVELAPDLTTELRKPCYADRHRDACVARAGNYPELAVAAFYYSNPGSVGRLLDDDDAPVAYKLAAAVKSAAEYPNTFLTDRRIERIATGLVELVGLKQQQLHLPPVIV